MQGGAERSAQTWPLQRHSLPAAGRYLLEHLNAGLVLPKVRIGNKRCADEYTAAVRPYE